MVAVGIRRSMLGGAMRTPGESAPNIDPELAQQLEDSEPSDLIDAVFVLDSAGTPLAPDVVGAEVHRLVEQAEAETGLRVSVLNVLPNLASFVVRASPSLVERLIEQPGVGSAIANRRRGSETTS